MESKSTLSSVVSTLLRASMSSAVSPAIPDEDLDRHVADIILKEAKQKAESYDKLGIKAYLPAGPDPNTPRPNKRFLSSIIRSTDDHNKTILRAQALAAQEIKREREEEQRRERRARAEEATAAERSRRRKRRDDYDSDEWSSRKSRDRERSRPHSRTWDCDWRKEPSEYERDREHVRSRRRHRSRSGDSERDRRHKSSHKRASSQDRDIDEDRHRSERGRRKRRRYESKDDERDCKRLDIDVNSRRPSKGKERDGDGISSPVSSPRVRSPSPLPPPPPRRPRGRPVTSTSVRSPSVSPPPLPPAALPSKMDRYFQDSYDPRLDVAPLSVPTVPKTGLINDSEYEAWDAMLELLRQRREDKEEQRRLEKLGFDTSDKKIPTSKLKKYSDSIMEIEYKKKGSVREWDLGKEEF